MKVTAANGENQQVTLTIEVEDPDAEFAYDLLETFLNG